MSSLGQLVTARGPIDGMIMRTNFTVNDYTEAMDILTTIDREMRTHFERIMRLLLNANPGMFDYIQNALCNNSFSLSTSLIPRWRNCLSYSSLRVLERMGFVVFDPEMKVDSDLLTAYVRHEDSEMCDILITDHHTTPTFEAVALSIYNKNYDLAIKYLNGIVDKVLVWLVHLSDSSGVEWLVEVSGKNPRSLGFLRQHTCNTRMNAVLTKLGIPR